MRSTIAALALAAVALVPGPTAAKLVVMHGFADYTSALLWVQAESPGKIDIAWRVDGEPREQTMSLDASAANDNVVLARIVGLAPGRDARYRVSGDGDVREGTLRAHPFWSKPQDAPQLKLAIGSCFFLADASSLWGDSDYGGDFRIFDSIAAKRPDMMLWLGDNLYFQRPDYLDPAALAARYRRQRAFEPLQRLLTAAPQIAIWDDHDYGPNDADASYTMKGETLALFKRYWANPSYGLPETAGVFGYAHLGDIDLFLLDDRYYRSGNRAIDGPSKTMLGRAQLAWLRNALLYSRAPLKLVVNGSQMWNRANRFEGWNHYATEQKAFADWLVSESRGRRRVRERRPALHRVAEDRAAQCVSALRVHVEPADIASVGRAGSGRARKSGRRARHAREQAPIRHDHDRRPRRRSNRRPRKLRQRRRARLAPRDSAAQLAFRAAVSAKPAGATPLGRSCRSLRHHVPQETSMPSLSPRAIAWSIVAVVLALFVALASPRAGAFCGFYVGKADAGLFNEASQVIVVRRDNRTVISMANDYRGELTEFALVVPVPKVLERGQIRIGERKLFERIDAYSAPRLAEYYDADPCARREARAPRRPHGATACRPRRRRTRKRASARSA